jgi:hypothetical protein
MLIISTVKNRRVLGVKIPQRLVDSEGVIKSLLLTILKLFSTPACSRSEQISGGHWQKRKKRRIDNFIHKPPASSRVHFPELFREYLYMLFHHLKN